jgi:twitching motility protein PilT
VAFIDQREVGVDTPSFSAALRAALRQDPDVSLLGEMRDLETIHTALVAAETGHAVFSTLHTLDATESVQRIVAAFPPRDQQQIRLQLATTLRGVISLRLIRRKEGVGRVPAVEVMVATDYIRDCIVNPEKTRLIPHAIAAGASQYGMQTFDQSLFHLYSQGLIELEDALRQASKPDDFKLLVAGIHSESSRIEEDPEALLGAQSVGQQ